MSLDAAGLKDALQALTEHCPPTREDAAHSWAEALKAFASGVVPASTQVDAAASAMETALLAAFAGIELASTTAAFEAAFLAFATTIGAGMAPAFVATPPPAPVGFAALFAVMQPSGEAFAIAWSTAIATWMHTGTATPAAGGAPVPWN